MPTYEYACGSCGFQWEEIQKISADPITECPKCKAPKAERQISGGNFILKGGGWYADLYSSTKPAAKSEGSSTSSSTETKTKSEAPKTEAKPASTGTSSGGTGGSSGGST